MVSLILLEIWKDRKSSTSTVIFALSILTTELAFSGLFISETIADEGKYISTTIIIVVSVLIAQGYYHQILIIIDSGSTGAVSLKMSQFILMMDISTIAFAISMGLIEGWPLLVLAITSATTKIVIMYLFK